jgi:peptidoglycan/LPS O-acetylase OafA/YrhL
VDVWDTNEGTALTDTQPRMSAVTPGERPASSDRGRHRRARDEGRVTGAGFRTDIQALRAVAVLAVVVNHLWPEGLTGGYVGVDVFFVISGFLISSHLCREITQTGRVRLGRFYARRVRRLLPAAFLVLGFCVVAAYFLLPYPRWAATAQHAIASALYAENWLLAAESVNYSAADAAASLEQHYWSLSVEEQFYLVWPLLLVLLFKVRQRRAQAVGVVAVGAASFVYCVYLTQHASSQAYFVTPVRIWEFAIGALVALAGARLVLPARFAGFASFAGLAMIIGSAFVYDHTTPFPGYLALVPTVGTGLVIVAGNHAARQWHTALTAARPVQWLGSVSYSLYLWHWPLIMVAPFVVGQVLTTPYRLAVLAVSVVLAYGTKVLVEDQGMSWRPLATSSRLTFAAMVAGLVLLTAGALGLNWTYDRHVAQAERAAAPVSGPCHGAAAMAPEEDCADPFGPATVVTMGPANDYYRLPPDCVQPDDNMLGETKTTWVCDFSQGAPSPEVVWHLGDSHAVHWMGPLVDLARERGWQLKIGTLGACPFAKVEFTGYRTPADEGFRQGCMGWTRRMAGVVAADKPSMVFMSFFARMESVDDGSGRSQTEQYRDGLEPYWRTWTEAGARVFVLADPPLNGDVRPPDCVALNPEDPIACAVDRAAAQPPDPLVEAARLTPSVSLVDLTDYFCDERRCYSVIGNVVVYVDANHMNLEFSRSLKPMIAAAIDGP